jgi:imidazole glycerol-phosphate synthase subunit HisF
MYRPRIIPVMLLKNGALVKTTAFGKERYIGDPINALHIFNALKADEVILLDIEASKQNRAIELDLVKKISEEAYMPFSVGGGICTCDQIAERIALGAEKVILGSVVFDDLDFVKEAALRFGSSTLVCCMDVKKDWLGRYGIVTYSGRKKIKGDVGEWAKKIQDAGIGEIIIQSVDRDGKMIGYDIPLIEMIAKELTIPVSVLGGAAGIESMRELINSDIYINGLAAGSMFVYHGARKGILINYPTREKINELFDSVSIE